MSNNVPNRLHILIIGNSFSVDTMRYVADIAREMGISDVKIGNLYVGGCSLRMHLERAQGEMPVYTYYKNVGEGWAETPETKISTAIADDDWDYIGIWPGTKDGSRHSEPSSYEPLPALIKYVRERATNPDVKLMFNMTWMGEPEKNHPELASFGGDQLKLHAKIAEMMQTIIIPSGEFCCVAPMGTAIQNARTSTLGPITRDYYHLTKDVGRYIAGLTFFGALTGLDITNIKWAPEGVDEKQFAIAIESAANAIKTPFEVTPSKL